MRIIKKSRLPRWVIAKIPYGGEEQTISSFIVPFVLFSLMGIGMLWHQIDEVLWIKIVVAVILICIILVIVWRLLVHVDILRMLRNRIKIHYQLTEDKNEKLELEKRLSDLCVKLKKT